MKALDTNVIVRYLVQDDPDQSRKATALIEGAASRGERLFVTAVVLCELVWVLRGAYEYGRDEIASALEKILAAIEFWVEDRDIAHRALADFRDEGGDFADYLIGWRARKAGVEKTATFDRRLRKSPLFEVL